MAAAACEEEVYRSQASACMGSPWAACSSPTQRGCTAEGDLLTLTQWEALEFLAALCMQPLLSRCTHGSRRMMVVYARAAFDMQAPASQRRKTPSMPHATSRKPKPMPGHVKRTAHDDNLCQSQADCTCQTAAHICSNYSYTGTWGPQDTKASHAWAAARCSEPLPTPLQHAKSYFGHDRCHHRGEQGKPAAYRMRGSGVSQNSRFEVPGIGYSCEEQPQASIETTEEVLDSHCSVSAEHQAPLILSEQDSRRIAQEGTFSLHPLGAMSDVRTEHGGPTTQGSHEQLLADIDSFIKLLQRPSQAVRNPLQPEHTAIEEGSVHAVGAEGVLPAQCDLQADVLNMSGTDEGTIIATANSSSMSMSGREHTLCPSKARLDCSLSLKHTGQQHVDTFVEDGYSNSSLALAAAGTVNELSEKQGEPSAIWDDDWQSYSTKGISTEGRMGLFKHPDRTAVKTDHAVHQLHDLEDGAQASLDELEDLLREQQLKVSGLYKSCKTSEICLWWSDTHLAQTVVDNKASADSSGEQVTGIMCLCS